MKILFHAPPGELSDHLLRAVKEVLAGEISDLRKWPCQTWKGAVAEAELLMIDITASTAGASYLMGLADASSKRAILVAAIEEPRPAIFDNHAIIIHQWNMDFLKSELQKITGAGGVLIEAESVANDDSPMGKFHQVFGDLVRAHGYVHRGPVEFDGSTFTLREQEMELPLVQEISKRAKSLNLRVRLL